MVTKFKKDKRYIFDLKTYKISLKDLEPKWPIKCNQKEVNVITENMGFIIIDGTSYQILPWWCKEKPTIKKMVIKDGEEL